MDNTRKFDKVVNLAKNRGFVFPSAEIYGGLNSTYDYGPLGVELKNNIKKAWWDFMLAQPDVVGLDSAILSHPKIWEASGHLESFTDPLVDCKKCKARFRSDHLLEKKGLKPNYLKDKPPKNNKVRCPDCGGELTGVRQFNLMFKTFLGPVEDQANQIYLRPETAQGIYLNFLNIKESMRLKMPFGVAQIGKAFRNEITPGNFIFRMREFEQMEMQYFVRASEADKIFNQWKKWRYDWYLSLGVKKENLRFREHDQDELAHYAKKAVDIEYRFDFSKNETFKELEGIHHRGTWDLCRHQEFSGEKFTVRDESGEEYLPTVVETSGGADRSLLAFLMDAYQEIEGGRTTTTKSTKEVETVLKLHPKLVPIKIAILPLSKKEQLAKLAKEIYNSLANKYRLQYDETSAIGRRYRRQDEIGTPYCVTIDFDSLEDKKVTVRDRDSMKQERIAIAELSAYFQEKFD
ncbi:MAG: glycine--tRNA ligase [Candidatus Komeilibacteria bacterium CG11_big_fil_rev_8_21_14_0_20_36_20]|uniref:Glycine--tRNA ligase n=1 Tax=Candidatus Komeilibacteria bacterium CG11_big_fil_rev_8_21_14_0_20_36_20 TaxID=1974477 RepID=A0A2H0NGB2_9BACT|nr:MAG: glycine--tRNA ligase [Candidatus Komeilibacteria bacterium CG11_big_fil_rev_8_21_14_0_20_36_20]PIR81248.1 MAG: glycine--tRNA ligase [Candidatus Komeilibacteria bacterium CG10_big_fil_rev_8_21_14_0_10_36_65]PJC55212.1 MAG: glycine--tRNA ligase [Candidatus Komeilibacteria bacterium CG_4_9_14_0_2_um_filter_36_13]